MGLIFTSLTILIETILFTKALDKITDEIKILKEEYRYYDFELARLGKELRQLNEEVKND